MKVERVKSVKRIYQEMEKALLSESKGSHWITLHCSSQSKLAMIEKPSIGIYSMSLNTFIKYCNTSITGGFKEVNRIRRQLASKNKQKVSIAKKKSKTQILEERLEKAERARIILLRAYNELNTICLDAIARSPEYEYDYKRHKAIYKKYFKIGLLTENE